MLQQVYDGSWHLPGIAFLSVTLLFLAFARKSPFITGFTVMFAWLIAADAWANGAVSPFPEPTRVPLMIVFVWLGDWRYFLLLERYWGGPLNAKRVLRSAVLASIVPAAALIAILLSGNRLELRTIFLFYEMAFFTLALGILMEYLPRRRDISAEGRAFVAGLTKFELLQYGLWAVADMLLIGGQQWAMFVRLTANVFYYALFVPFVWWRSPDSPGRQKTFASLATLTATALALSFVTVKFAQPAKPVAAAAPAPELSFIDNGKQAGAVSLPTITQTLPVVEVGAFDPYYKHDKRWRTVSIENLLQKGFKQEPSALAGQDFVLRAADGFAAYMPGKLLLEGGAHVAFEDLDVAEWEPIGPRKDNPGPFYLVWSGPEQQNLDTHARPWQLASIELIAFDSQFPHVRPEGVADNSPAKRGFEIFRIQCLACHAINQAGGKVGPEVNVPRNILEYRDASVVREFVRNPLAFRYTVMPAHLQMTKRELDDVIAYLDAMKNQKYDSASGSGARNANGNE